jgi:Sulfotransferase family
VVGVSGVSGWIGRHEALLRLARCQLFFIGGAPRSGTTWLQQLLDSHPEVSCRGEGFFQQHLAEPLDELIAARRGAIEAKNRVFRHTGGYALPADEDGDTLLGTGILLALDRQRDGKKCRAIGEKTPENVFLFPRLKRLFPTSKFIGIARDPRDVLVSAWHFFQAASAGDDLAAKTTFVRSACPQIAEGCRAMLSLCDRYPTDCRIVTYETMHTDTRAVAGQLFRFLGVSDSPEIVSACVACTSFAALAQGRQAGQAKQGAFLRKGVVGDWSGAFNSDQEALITRELGWTYPVFGWRV